MIYFTADLHFYHDNIIKHASRPFADAEKMNKALVQNWNNKIGANDEVYILGDFTMKSAAHATEVLAQLKGRKFLIRGNHDKFADQATFDKTAFGWVKDYHELEYKNEQFVLFHYPIDEWNGFFRGSVHLHGHQHNHADYNWRNVENGLRRFDVGVDATHMSPISIEQILDFLSLMQSC